MLEGQIGALHLGPKCHHSTQVGVIQPGARPAAIDPTPWPTGASSSVTPLIARAE